ncbi:MAG: circadian clock KaiB family protein [Casimicrobiaceae bacterium]
MKVGAGNRARYKFRLYVAGNAPNSAQAIANLAGLCREHLVDRHDVEIVDVFRHPQRALKDRIFMTPTLVKLAPQPAPKLIVGNLSQKAPLLLALELESVPE